MAPGKVKAVLLKMETRSPRAALGLAVQCFAGIRSAEIYSPPGLRWEDVDFEEGLIIVPANLSKTRRRREVKITDNLMKWLMLYRRESGKISLTQSAY